MNKCVYLKKKKEKKEEEEKEEAGNQLLAVSPLCAAHMDQCFF